MNAMYGLVKERYCREPTTLLNSLESMEADPS